MPPDIIFIIPYRDRDMHRSFYRKHMKSILEDLPEESYRTFFVHQRDNQPFNRGAIKNIGFLAMKQEYPEDYKRITFVFNDIDVMPFEKKQILYKTSEGIVKHFYGFNFALGGIVSITGSDFEKLNGYPNFWSWGWEDNELQRRAELNGLHIDRSTFYQILSKDFIHYHHGAYREVNPDEKRRYSMKTTEGILDIKLNKFAIEGDMIQVDSFSTGTIPTPEKNKVMAIGGQTHLSTNTNTRKPLFKMNLTTKL